MSADWVTVGAEADFAGTMRLFQVGKRKIAVTQVDGELFAFDGLCPHVAGPMHRAEIVGTIITCPFHAWRFDLREGGREIHGYRPLPVYEVKVEDGEVYLLLGAAEAATALESRPCVFLAGQA